MKELLEVGDLLITKAYLGDNEFKITRVTKYLAMSKRESDGYEHKFKREISCNMSHPVNRYSTVVYEANKNVLN